MEANEDGSLAYDGAEAKDERLNKLLTQYRESPNLIGVITTHLGQIQAVAEAGAALPSVFDIDTAEDEVLTTIGKWLGWPRVHCRGRRPVVFGFECEDDCGTAIEVGGFCEGVYWACPGGPEFVEHTFSDDAVYRRYLKARRIKLKGDLRREMLLEAVEEIYGAGALILSEGPGVITLSPGRFFTAEEKAVLHLSIHVLPIALGVRLEWAESSGDIFGFGDGWAGFCDGYFPKVLRNPLDRAPRSDTFGFGTEYAGWCQGSFGPSGASDET